MKRLFFKRLLVLPCVVILLSLSNIVSPPVAHAASAVSLSPNQGSAGTKVTATGSDWSAGHSINVTWEGQSGNLAQTKVDGNGKFTVSFTVPSTATQGKHTIYFVDGTGNVGYFIPATFTVTPKKSLALIDAYTSDQNQNKKTSFSSNEAIYYHSQVKNTTGNQLNVTILFSAASSNTRNIIMSKTYNATMEPGAFMDYYTPSYVPGGARSTTYKYSTVVNVVKLTRLCNWRQ